MAARLAVLPAGTPDLQEVAAWSGLRIHQQEGLHHQDARMDQLLDRQEHLELEATGLVPQGAAYHSRSPVHRSA